VWICIARVCKYVDVQQACVCDDPFLHVCLFKGLQEVRAGSLFDVRTLHASGALVPVPGA